MNRLTYNLIYWPCFLLYVIILQGLGKSFSFNSGAPTLCLILMIVYISVVAIRTMTLKRSLWNLLWLFIPIAHLIYPLFIGISNEKVKESCNQTSNK